MRGHPWSLLAFASAFVLAPACGGAAPSDLLGSSPSTNTGSSSGGGSGSSSGSSSGGTDAGTHYDASGSSSGGGLPEASTMPEASPVDTGPPAQSIYCGDGTPACSSPDVCCASADGMGNPPAVSFQCAAKDQCGTANDPGAIIECSTTADCPASQVCCGDDLNGVYSEVACAAQCTGTTSSGASEVQFCDPSANDCPTATPTCQKSGVLTGFYVCR
jgi:hypothetical protein